MIEVESKTRRTFTRSHRASSLKNTTNPLSPTMQLKRTMSLTGPKLYGDRQRARAFYQMDQGGRTHAKGRTTGHEP